MYYYYFEKLQVFANLREFVNEIYLLTKKFPKNENFILTQQIRRAAVSSMVNLVEGSGRITNKDQAHFLTMAFSSVLEVMALLMVSVDQLYLSKVEFEKLREKINLITNQLNALKRSQLNRNES